MADVFVRNNLNPHKSVRFSVNIVKYVGKYSEGESKYYIEVGTTYTGIYVDEHVTYSGQDGVYIRPTYIDTISGSNLDQELSAALGKLSAYIDWGPLLKDGEAPYVSHMEPVGSGVSIYSNVRFSLRDNIPTTGIDLSEMKVTFDNGTQSFDITNEVIIEGDPLGYDFLWQPPIREINR